MSTPKYTEHGLTPRQLNIARMIAEGKDRAQIAALLRIPPKRYDQFRTRIMERLNIVNNVQLAHWAISKGIVELRAP